MEDRLSPQMEVQHLVDLFEEAEEASLTSRETAHRCRDYYDGKQLTEDERAAIVKSGQPPIVINRVRRKVDWLRGLEMQGRTDPKAFPREPRHEQGAEAATDAIRYVCDNADWDRCRSAAWGDMLVEGIGAVEVIHEMRPPMAQPEIVVNRYQFDRVFYDPHSMEADFSDARYLGAVIWSDLDDLKRRYPDKVDVLDGSLDPTDGNSEFEDKPTWRIWSDPRRRRVRTVLMHHKEGDTWQWCLFTRGGKLEYGESPYRNEDGESECPFIMQSAYVDRDNNRYGVVLDMLDPQDEINKRRSKLLHQLNNRQTTGIKGAVNNVAAMKRELSKSDGHVEVNAEAVEDAARVGMKPFEMLPQADQTAGQFSLLQEAKSEIDLMGANSGLSGKDGDSDQSGRAILAKQQGGMIEIAPLTDNLSDFTRRVYRAIWSRIRQYWTEEKWVRVTDDERNVRFVGLNRRVTLHERLGQMPPEQAMAMAQEMQLYRGDPRLQMPTGIENNVEEIDVDIVLEEVPDQVTLAGETFEQIVSIATSQPGSVPPDVLIELAPNLPRDVKDRILQRMEQMQQQSMQQGQMQAQAGMERSQAEIRKIDSETQENMTNAAHNMAQAQADAVGF